MAPQGPKPGPARPSETLGNTIKPQKIGPYREFFTVYEESIV